MTSSTHTLDATLLISAVTSFGVEVELAPSSWIGDRFNTELLAGDTRARSLERKKYDFPEGAVAYKIDGVPVLVGALNCEATRSAVQDLARRYRNQASIARSWLGLEASNLQLFFLGIRGTAHDAVWRQFAAEIETDDRVCRKLVWLPPQDPNQQDAISFLQRTFLARPWEQQESVFLPRLDAMSEIGLPPGWTEIVENEALEGDDLVSALIAKIHKETGK